MSSIADQLERRLAPDRLHLLRRAAAIAARRGARLYLVGGAVRDVLLGGSPTDLDVVADGAFAGLPDALASGLGGRVIARSQFDTAKLAVDDLTLDLARARTESYARPGALPDVRPGTMREDLTRRDFSVNAMAFSLTEGDWGVLLDPHGGAADLRARLIRVLHPGSFVDDATRILRAVRYAGRLGFEIESATRGLLERDLRRLDTISGDRLRRELALLLAEDEVAHLPEARPRRRRSGRRSSRAGAEAGAPGHPRRPHDRVRSRPAFGDAVPRATRTARRGGHPPRHVRRVGRRRDERRRPRWTAGPPRRPAPPPEPCVRAATPRGAGCDSGRCADVPQAARRRATAPVPGRASARQAHARRPRSPRDGSAPGAARWRAPPRPPRCQAGRPRLHPRRGGGLRQTQPVRRLGLPRQDQSTLDAPRRYGNLGSRCDQTALV